MNIMNFMVQEQYMILMYLLVIGVFICISYLITIPGNRKIEMRAINRKTKKENKKIRKKFFKISIIIFLIITLILFMKNISLTELKEVIN